MVAIAIFGLSYRYERPILGDNPKAPKIFLKTVALFTEKPCSFQCFSVLFTEKHCAFHGVALFTEKYCAFH